MGQFLRHTECPKCASSDGRGYYEDGTSWCFACESYFPADSDTPTADPRTETTTRFSRGSYVDIPKRGLRESICRKYGYQVGEGCQIAPYRNDQGEIVAQKIRRANKEFSIEGDGKRMPLFGQHLFNGGKSVVVTEGEVDALSVGTAFDGKWAAVSLPNGASSAAKDIKRAYEWLDKFDTIVLCFDQDEPGREATQAVAAILPVGKVKIMTLPQDCKDANDALVKIGPHAITQAYWNAKEWRPDGIVSLRDIREKAKKPPAMGLPWCLETLTKGTYGRRAGELYMFGAGTGVGKTDLFVQQIEYDISELQEPVGVFFLEQPNVETVRRIAGKADGKAYHVPDGSWDQAQYEATVDRLADSDKVYLYNHFGQSDWDIIKSRIRYMHYKDGVKLFYVDHLTALADPSKERESLETITAEMAGMAQELGIILHVISHLSTPEGKGHEEGARVQLKHFKGSRAIGFWAFLAIGLERDKTHEDPAMRNIMTVRCLKDRTTGRFDGETFFLKYNRDTCRLEETSIHFDTPEGFNV